MTKKCKPVMLAQSKMGWNYKDLIKNDDGSLEIAENTVYLGLDIAFSTAQHLHLISDDEIKDGNWWYHIPTGQIGNTPMDPRLSESSSSHLKLNFKQIIASTDPSLGVPAIQQSLLEAYVKADGKIDEVELEMIQPYHKCSGDCYMGTKGVLYAGLCRHPLCHTFPEELKLTENNEVVVVKITQYIEVQTPAKCLKELEDQELKDAARSHAYKQYGNSCEARKERANTMEDFKAGAEWQQNRVANEAIDFVNWLHHNQFMRYLQSNEGPVPFGPNKGTTEPVWKSTKIHYSPDFYTSKDLYKIWQENK